MTIRVALNHTTEYAFDKPINIHPHILRLRPATHYRNKIISYSLKIDPEEHYINWQQDPFGNFQARLVFPEKASKLKFEIEVIIDMNAINPFDFFVEDSAQHFPFEYDELLLKELQPFLEVKESGPRLQAWVEQFKAELADKEELTINDFMVLVNQKVQQQIGYNIRLEPGVQSCEETLTINKGSCRDTAWLLIQILRHLGLASRFASGYLVQLKSDQKSLDGPSGPEEDFTDLHAWCEIYIPGAGWVGLDPTSGLLASEGHIPLACTASPESAAPITGATDECEVEFSYSNTVARILEDPRVTRPYRPEQWEAIQALGAQVDQRLLEQDVRLTMGGEPTFVAADDMESEQWSTEALGDEKLRRSAQLLTRLKEQFGPTGITHFGQGKWYPREPIRRWAMGCFWRNDGGAIWNDPSLLASFDQEASLPQDLPKRFATQLAQNLGVATEHAQELYEDAFYYAWKEQRLPANLNPYEADLDDDLERKRLAKVLTNGLNNTCGMLLPLEWDYTNQQWRSSHWPMRNDRIVLIPGDSPAGLRLPLDTLPHITSEQRQRNTTHAKDPFAPTSELPAHFADFLETKANRTSELSAYQTDSVDLEPSAQYKGPSARYEEPSAQSKKPSARKEPSANSKAANEPDDSITVNVVRTALCVEIRDGKLFVFLPPTDYLEHYLHLIHTLEQTAKALKVPIALEGYEPPKDHRISGFLVTPDPGVIEVNIHPANCWQDLVHQTQTLYEQAYQCRLSTEKFMLDGRFTGTGGGNHITLGAATPADSPFLRRPDLLRSLVTFWQHHPSLSYLFSGQFIGPTSQAPRVDEGRPESLYNLEIAFQQMPVGEVPQPWLVDRLMRNLLVDVTGNTHRAELCIDKLYSPDSTSGRQGLVEFRGFEMPPHYQMSLVQMLLLRSLVSRFWKDPYHHKLVRWGTQLHDQFMLPHFYGRI